MGALTSEPLNSEPFNHVRKMDKKLSDTISSYFANKDEVIAVYLFGSYAKGTESHLVDMIQSILLLFNCLRPRILFATEVAENFV